AVREVLGADERRAAGVQIAVLAGQVAAVREIPRDDVRPIEHRIRDQGSGIRGSRCRFYMPKKSFALSRIFSSISRVPCSRAKRSIPVLAIGRTNSGMLFSRASAAGVHVTISCSVYSV